MLGDCRDFSRSAFLSAKEKGQLLPRLPTQILRQGRGKCSEASIGQGKFPNTFRCSCCIRQAAAAGNGRALPTFGFDALR